PRTRRAREHPLPHRRPLPRMGLRALGLAGVHDLARVQEDLHGRMDRRGQHHGTACPAPRPAGRRRRGASAVRGAPVSGGSQPLPPVAAEVDAALAAIDAELDWLVALSPLGTDALWEDFDASGHTRVAPLRYAEPVLDMEAMRKRLGELPMERIESPLLAGV